MNEVKLSTHASVASGAGAPAKPVPERSQAAPSKKDLAHAEQAKLPEQTVEEVARRIDSYLRSVGRSIEFHVDGDSGRTVISVRDAETGDLIRQIPNEEVLRLAQMAADETVVLLDERV